MKAKEEEVGSGIVKPHTGRGNLMALHGQHGNIIRQRQSQRFIRNVVGETSTKTRFGHVFTGFLRKKSKKYYNDDVTVVAMPDKGISYHTDIGIIGSDAPIITRFTRRPKIGPLLRRDNTRPVATLNLFYVLIIIFLSLGPSQICKFSHD